MEWHIPFWPEWNATWNERFHSSQNGMRPFIPWRRYLKQHCYDISKEIKQGRKAVLCQEEKKTRSCQQRRNPEYGDKGENI
jgi:hypothetical protein